jgi:hypothetical protein
MNGQLINKARWSALQWLMGLTMAVALVLVVGPAVRLPGLVWYDGQRVGQLLLLLGLALLILRWPNLLVSLPKLVTGAASGALAALALLGLVSVVLAHHPEAAFVDYGIWLACALLAWTIAALRARAGEVADAPLLLMLLLPVAVYGLGFWFRYLGLLLVEGVPYTAGLLEGFDNRRYLAQWQTPLLAAGAGLVLWVWPQSRWGAFGLACLLAQWWCINLWTGTRSTLLGMLVAAALSLLLSHARWRWLQVQAALLATGFALYWLTSQKILAWMDLAQPTFWGGRMNLAGLARTTEREVLWLEAWRQGLASPWFGSGPAHFADSLIAESAHPHNLVLQFFAEWGVMATVLVVLLVVMLLRRVARSLQYHPGPLTLALAGGVAGSVGYAMTDGIHVTPLGQLVVAVFVGWLLGVLAHGTSPGDQAVAQRPPALARPLALLVLAAMVTALTQVTGLRQQQDLVSSIQGKTNRLTQFLPRTWQSSVVLQPSELALARRLDMPPGTTYPRAGSA